MNRCAVYSTGYKKMSQKTSSELSKEAKELNIPHKNCLKTNQDLEKAIIETQLKCKYIIFGNDIRICEGCLNELREQEKIAKGMYQERLMEDQITDICQTLANAVEKDWMLIDQKNGEVICSVVDKTNHEEKL